jgi:hypothetical protein
MSSKTKRLIAIGAAAASLAVAAPATAAEVAAAGPCVVRSIAGIQEWYQEVAVVGASAPAGAIDVRLTCGIVRYGETVWTGTDPLSGPVAALATTASVHAGPIGSCYILSVSYIDRYTYTNTCP